MKNKKMINEGKYTDLGGSDIASLKIITDFQLAELGMGEDGGYRGYEIDNTNNEYYIPNYFIKRKEFKNVSWIKIFDDQDEVYGKKINGTATVNIYTSNDYDLSKPVIIEYDYNREIETDFDKEASDDMEL